MKAQGGGRGIVPPIHDLGARSGSVFNATPRPLYPRERDRVRIVQEAGWDSGVGLDGYGKSRPHRGLNPGPSSL